GWRTIALTAAYSLGAGLPLLVIAVGAGRVVRSRARELRAALGVVIALATVGIALDLDRRLQTAIGDYTGFLQRHTEETAYARKRIDAAFRPRAVRLDFGPAPDFRYISHWLNTRP